MPFTITAQQKEIGELQYKIKGYESRFEYLETELDSVKDQLPESVFQGESSPKNEDDDDDDDDDDDGDDTQGRNHENLPTDGDDNDGDDDRNDNNQGGQGGVQGGNNDGDNQGGDGNDEKGGDHCESSEQPDSQPQGEQVINPKSAMVVHRWARTEQEQAEAYQRHLDEYLDYVKVRHMDINEGFTADETEDQSCSGFEDSDYVVKEEE